MNEEDQICYIFSNQSINPSNGLFFHVAKAGDKNMTPLTFCGQANPYLLKFKLKECAKNRYFFIVYDRRNPENDVVHFCKIPSFSSYFISFISSKGIPKITPKLKNRLNWLNDKINSKQDIENCINFAFSPHKFNNFHKVTKKIPILSPIDEVRDLIFKFKPNGKFMKSQIYVHFTLDFIIFYQGNESDILHSPIFDYFLEFVLNELVELEYYVELSAITFVSNSMNHPSPLEFSHLNNHNLDEDRITKICESVMAFHGPLFLIWVFNIHCISLFEALFEQWKTGEKTDKILKIVSQKLQINDFSFVSLKKYFKFVKKFLSNENLDEIREMIIAKSNFQFDDSVIDMMKQTFLEMKENITKSHQRIDLIDFTGDDEACKMYVNRVREIRGAWLNIPESYFYVKRAEGIDYKVKMPPYTFREGEPEAPKKQVVKSTCTIEKKSVSSNLAENRIKPVIAQRSVTDMPGDFGFRPRNELSSRPSADILSSKNKIMMFKRPKSSAIKT